MPTSIREGAYVAPGVVCMPPMYINIGAYVGAESLIDSHALVGSCAQVGERVHVSAGAQIGGVIRILMLGAPPDLDTATVLVHLRARGERRYSHRAGSLLRSRHPDDRAAPRVAPGSAGRLPGPGGRPGSADAGLRHPGRAVVRQRFRQE